MAWPLRSLNALTRSPSASGGAPGAVGQPTSTRKRTKHRNAVERCFDQHKQFRTVATRFNKLADRYQAGLRLASLIL
ncbi:hypothetical protein DN051_38025 [Streptomyces cadmiisoli]|uniref:Uncharacterized protein n=1 Tax=Streptomyces cadmiisoli TaxID=2184053 RepID=A0A2Z4JAK4_9ACTN|nr:hypothetical protein DN051_38025 [Streptomyces cadmiisoli]